MGINTEKRLTSLENELKALKSAYTIYGGAVKTYVSTSQLFEIPIYYDEAVNMQIKFTSLFEHGKNILISMTTQKLYRADGTSYANSSWVKYKIQDNSGSVIICPTPPVTARQVRLTVYANSPGTFTQIQ